MKHMYDTGEFSYRMIARFSSCNRRTTNSMSAVERVVCYDYGLEWATSPQWRIGHDLELGVRPNELWNVGYKPGTGPARSFHVVCKICLR